MESVLEEKAYKLAIRIVNAYKFLCKEHKEYVLSKQLLRAGTSIAANICEGRGGISKADFSAKLSISYKEARETKYWLSLLKDTGYLSEIEFQSIYDDTDEVAAMLFQTLKSSGRV